MKRFLLAPRIGGAVALPLALVACSGLFVASAQAESLGKPPPSCEEAGLDFTGPCTVNTRMGTFSLQHEVRPGGLLTGTVEPHCGQPTCQISWPQVIYVNRLESRQKGPAEARAMGCTSTTTTCTWKIPKFATSTPYQLVEVGIAGGISRDYFGVRAGSKTKILRIFGTVTRNGAPARSIPIFVRNAEGGKVLTSDQKGRFDGDFAAATYAVGTDNPEACVVGSTPCQQQVTVGREGTITVNFKLDSCPFGGLRSGCLLKNTNFPRTRIPALVVLTATTAVQIERLSAKKWVPAEPGDVLGPGDKIRSGANGYATLSSAHRIRGKTDFVNPHLEIPRHVNPGEVGKIEVDEFGQLDGEFARMSSGGHGSWRGVIPVGPDARATATGDPGEGHIEWQQHPDWSDVKQARWNRAIDAALTYAGAIFLGFEEEQHRWRPKPLEAPERSVVSG